MKCPVHSEPLQILFDPMMGSETTIVAVMNCGMNAIGMEQDPVMFERPQNESRTI